MRALHYLFSALSLSFFAVTAGASVTSPEKGIEYTLLEPAQATDTGKKIEVIEFFSYACPHCFAFEPGLEEWVKKQGDAIVFKRVPVEIHRQWAPLQRTYYTLDAMGKADELSGKVFHAVHVDHKPSDTEAAVADLVASLGVDKKKFLDAYASFGVQTRVGRVAKLQEYYKVNSVPAVVIDGRFVTSPSMVPASTGDQSEKATMGRAQQVMDWLVAKAKADHATPVGKSAAK